VPERSRSNAPERNRHRNQDRSRILAQERNRIQRLALETQSDPDVFDSVPSLGPPPGRGADAPSAALDRPAGGRDLHLRDLIGSRPPLVLLQLEEAEDGSVRASPLVQARSSNMEALKVLRGLVESRFRAGRDLLSAEEWGKLLGRIPTAAAVRSDLLARLAVIGSTSFKLPADGKTPETTQTPNNIGLDRFTGLFAALPDGTPFSIRLLLKGLTRRGRFSVKDEDLKEHPFGRLSLEQRLRAVQRALEIEDRQIEERARTGQPFQAWTNDELRDYLRQTVKELFGLDIPVPTSVHLKNLKDALKRHGREEAFPNQRARQSMYLEQYGSRPGTK
jgi:hypothetical protein